MVRKITIKYDTTIDTKKEIYDIYTIIENNEEQHGTLKDVLKYLEEAFKGAREVKIFIY